MASPISDGDAPVEVRTIQGQETRVWQEPDEVHLEWRPTRPVFYRVAVGDIVKDADRDVESPLIKKWTVTEVTPDRVVAERDDDGETEVREWPRDEFERKLVVQSIATTLEDFERVTVHQFGHWGLEEVEHSEHTFVGEPYVMVLAYGDNGERYGLRYHFIEPSNSTDVELWRHDLAVENLSPELRTRLDERVADALTSAGYRVAS
ncbi:hypothetical protein [Haloarchaeobius sp. TZWWS8]|uniref:hypothetical protein n=1 Tax=Haloarchaeobius sp. TZWWS8 TaxID=3446121 RepID=UPI003EBDACEC